VWWFGADYLVWRFNGTDLPPLVVDSPLGAEPVLGLATTRELAGGDAGNDFRSGYRLRAGAWLDACHTIAVAGDFFELGEDDDGDFFYAGNSGRNTARPFFDAQTGLPNRRLISGPNTIVDGTAAVSVDDDFEGAGVWLEQSIYAVGDVSGNGPGTEVRLISGYRYFGLDSRLSISDEVTVQSGANAGDQNMRRDDFFADNEFHGGEIGLCIRFTQRNFWFDGTAMLAIGGNRRSVTIDGQTTTIPVGMVAQTDAGGLLTSSETNIGRYDDSEAQVIPEFRVGFSLCLTPNWIARLGYDVIVWSDVARAASQLPPNLAVDQRHIPPVAAGGGASPLFPGIGGSEFVVHGLDLGLECTY
jgi:hypothetical protein